MLTSLLPGFRQIRTPLTAGYIWLLAAWLIVDGRVGQGRAPYAIRRVFVASNGWHEAAVVSALSLGALLLGIIAEGLYGMGVHAVESRLTPKSDPVASFLGWQRLQSSLAGWMGRLRPGPTKSGLLSLNLPAAERVDAAERKLAGARTLQDLALGLGYLGDPREQTSEEESRLREQLLAIPMREIKEALSAWLVIRAVDQLDLLSRRLVEDHPELYSDYDRLKSEGEFRLLVSPPLLALILVLAVQWNPFIAIACLGIPVLVREAIRKADAASDLLIDAVLIGKVEPPAFEQLARAAGESS